MIYVTVEDIIHDIGLVKKLVNFIPYEFPWYAIGKLAI